jgi:hypothetical protein
LKIKITQIKRKKNQKNKDQSRRKKKQYTINLDWFVKLKTNKTFIKGQRKKIRNQKNKYQIRNNNILKIKIKWLNWKEIKFLQKKIPKL